MDTKVMKFDQYSSQFDPIVNYLIRDKLSPIYLFIHFFHRPQFQMNMHSHDFWQLYYVTNGDLKVTSEGNTFCVNPGCLHIQPALIPHALSSQCGYTQLGINFNAPARLRDIFLHPITISMPHMLEIVLQITALDDTNPFYTDLLNA